MYTNWARYYEYDVKRRFFNHPVRSVERRICLQQNCRAKNWQSITFSPLHLMEFWSFPRSCCNDVAVITILRSSQINSKSCYLIILLQSTFDIPVGMLGIPLFIYYLSSSIGGISNRFADSLACHLMRAPIKISSITVTALTLERYIAILHP